MNNRQIGGRSPGSWLGFFAKIVLGVAMLLYLGLHSYNFFTFTFKGDQWIFAILGLFTTSIGFVLWLVVYLYAAEDGLEKAVSMTMLFISLLGEFIVAGWDMYMNITGALAGASFTPEDLRNMSYVIAGLALINGLALVAGVAGQQIVDDLSAVNWPKRKESAGSSQSAPKRHTEAPHATQRTQDTIPNAPQHSLDEFLRVSGLTREQAQAQFQDRDKFMDYASGKFDYISGGNMKRLHGELTGSANPQGAALAGNNGRR